MAERISYHEILRNSTMESISRGLEHLIRMVELHAHMGGDRRTFEDLIGVIGVNMGVLVLERQRAGFSAPGYNRSVTVENDGSLTTWNPCGDADDPKHDPTIFAALATAIEKRKEFERVFTG